MTKLTTSMAAATSLWLVLATAASASVTAYTSQSAFDAAVTGETSHDFTGIAPPGGFAVVDPTVAGVTFTSNNIPFVIDTGYDPVYGVPFFSGQGNASNVPANEIDISLSGHSAFGFTYGSYISANEPYSATLNTGEVFDFSTPLAAGVTGFLGFVSTGAAISSIALVSQAGANVIINGAPQTPYGFAFDVPGFSLADPAAGIPEPVAWAMMTLGMGGVGAAMRARRRVRDAFSIV